MFELIPYNRRKTVVQRRPKGYFPMESLFNSFFNDAVGPFQSGLQGQMKVDIKENEKDYVIEADLPGINKEDIQIELKHDVLSIGVKHNEVTEEERDNYIRKERRTSSMSRSFQVENVKPDDVKAKFENGVLSITLLKSEEEKKNHHRIDIN